jgi:NADH-quinone oxidoreductase subunit L
MPATYRPFVIGTLALCGIFPFAGFWSKDEILGSVLAAKGLPGHVFLWGLGTLVAGMTSFYMGRAVIVTFLGSHRGAKHAEDAHGHGGHGEAHASHGPHESPKVMTVPLWFLAVFAVVIGFVGVPDNLGASFGMKNRFEHFLHAWSMEAGAFHFNVALISTVVAVAGLLLAFRVYRSPQARAEDPLPARLGPVHRLWSNLWYVDAFYLFLVKTVQQGIAWGCWIFERRGIIGGAVNGTSQGARILGERLRRVQAGHLTSYVSWILLGTVAVAIAVLLG